MNYSEDWTEIDDGGFIGLVGPFQQGGDGSAPRFRFVTGTKHRNRRDVVQGGALMTFADRALGIAARLGRETEAAVTMHLDMHFIDGVQLGETVETFPVVVRTSGKTVYVRADLTVGARVVAMASGIWLRLPLI